MSISNLYLKAENFKAHFNFLTIDGSMLEFISYYDFSL